MNVIVPWLLFRFSWVSYSVGENLALYTLIEFEPETFKAVQTTRAGQSSWRGLKSSASFEYLALLISDSPR